MTELSHHIADLDEGAFKALAKARLLDAPQLQRPDDGPSDFDLNPSAREPGDHLEPRAAAVLVPVLAGGPLRVLLTERTPHLSAHAGQIAFPGGKIDDGDNGPLDAALREAEEEIGLDRAFVEPLGFVEPYRTGTGFIVTPVVALIAPGYSVRPDPREVASVFDVPLRFLLDERNHRIDTLFWRGAERRYYAMPYEGRYIWGATAGIIRALHRRLFAE